ncbi:MAG: zf-HC2 domain-containing protein [Candidatus Eremiobacteraeota bacterium]|nr:zf-HC2 domain-containing protein [Candidatus Eremiobacteraeota bacterium]
MNNAQHINTATLIDYLRRELGPERDAIVLAHLEACDGCRSEYEAEASLGEMLKAAAAREELEFPSMIAARVWETIRNEKPSPFAWVATLFRPAIAVPAGLAAALALFFVSPLSHPADGPKIGAVYYLEEHAAQQAQNPLMERGPSASTFLETASADSGVPTELADDTSLGIASSGVLNAVR